MTGLYTVQVPRGGRIRSEKRGKGRRKRRKEAGWKETRSSRKSTRGGDGGE
jgi:hypothetical protein